MMHSFAFSAQLRSKRDESRAMSINLPDEFISLFLFKTFFIASLGCIRSFASPFVSHFSFFFLFALHGGVTSLCQLGICSKPAPPSPSISNQTQTKGPRRMCNHKLILLPFLPRLETEHANCARHCIDFLSAFFRFFCVHHDDGILGVFIILSPSVLLLKIDY